MQRRQYWDWDFPRRRRSTDASRGRRSRKSCARCSPMPPRSGCAPTCRWAPIYRAASIPRRWWRCSRSACRDTLRDVLDRLRRRGPRRVRAPAHGGRAPADRITTTCSARCARHRRRVPAHDPPHREPGAAHRARADAAAVRAGAPLQREGGADGRGRRRSARRLRHLQGIEGAPVLGRSSPSRPGVPRCSSACIRISISRRAQSAAYLKEFFGVGLDQSRRSVLLASAALGHHRAVQAVLVRRFARAGDGSAVERLRATLPGEDRAAGIRSTAPNTSRRRRCCRAICCPRRATAC